MKFQKYRWSRTYESAEEDLVELFQSQSIQPQQIVADASDKMSAQSHPQDTTIWCAEGSMVIANTQNTYSLQAGDALDIPANSAYSISYGFTGCTYYVQ